MNKHSKYAYAPWLLLIVVVVVPLLGWLSLYNWNPVLSPRSLFPLLGIWAFSIMWTHYAYGAARIMKPDKFKKNIRYSKITSWIVLILLLSHPGLLALDQSQQVGLKPPGSFFAAVPESLGFFISFGSVALLIFLSYEIFIRIKKSEKIRRYWMWVSVSQMLAMGLIFAHGLGIGQILSLPWMEVYWLLLGLSLLPAFFIIGKDDLGTQREARHTNQSISLDK